MEGSCSTCLKDAQRPGHFSMPKVSKTGAASRQDPSLISYPAGGDVYVLSRILHDWPDDKAAVILANCRKAVKDDSTLLIRDNVLSDNDVQGSTLDITMMIMTGGEERTESEWKSLLKSAGFALTRVYKKEGQLDLIEAKPDKQPLRSQ